MINAKRCSRTHCRYTGPFYLVMIVPVLVLTLKVVTIGFYGWVTLAILILAGSRIIWRVTERVWSACS